MPNQQPNYAKAKEKKQGVLFSNGKQIMGEKHSKDMPGSRGLGQEDSKVSSPTKRPQYNGHAIGGLNGASHNSQMRNGLNQNSPRRAGLVNTGQKEQGFGGNNGGLSIKLNGI